MKTLSAIIALIMSTMLTYTDNPDILTDSAVYAGYFDFDLDKIPESYYYAYGTFFVKNSDGDIIGSFPTDYADIYDVKADLYKGSEWVTIRFGGHENLQEFEIEINDGRLEVISKEKLSHPKTEGYQAGALVVSDELDFQTFYFGKALMNSIEDFKNGKAKADYNYFQREIYRDTDKTNARVMFADIIDGKPLMAELTESGVYFEGKEITPEDYNQNRIGSFYRVEDQISSTGMSGTSTVFIFRMSNNGIIESEISHLGNDLTHRDLSRNEYYLTDFVEFDGGFNYTFGGRIIKEYCFYRADGGTYKEYGGIDVPIDEFLMIDGAIEAITPYLYNDRQTNIINNVQYRENNTFAVNLISLWKEGLPNADQSHCIFRYEERAFELIRVSGGYLDYSQSASYGRDVATYPEEFPR
jgi:hypothetical protein